jgi:asparagine synthetase B (glutamine-hydrolysing)
MFYRNGATLGEAAQKTFQAIQGMASIAAVFNDVNHLLLATNNGSLYQCIDESNTVFIFSSERYILEQLTKKRFVHKLLGSYNISQVAPGEARLIDIENLSIDKFALDPDVPARVRVCRKGMRRHIKDILPKRNRQVRASATSRHISRRKVAAMAELFPYDNINRYKLRRCTNCILPESVPFIEFDRDGVCNFCRSYAKLNYYGTHAVRKAVEPYRRRKGEPDCIVGVSGGRDSSYALHYVKTVLKMNPVAYTYDWGVVTDLARRNIARICGKLGVEHVLISADIGRKREYIKKNVSAWLKHPSLGMIPLFMAGDKQYFYFAQQLKKRTGVKLVILGENMLERTDFKTGFAGVKPFTMDPDHVYTLLPIDKIRLLQFYGKEYLTNRSYLNASLLDTLFAFCCYYLLERSYLNLYRYVPWDEETVVSTLCSEYDWELATDTTSTWRIGDGTSALYNYIYLTVAGFTENDTFRSNQIREGIITRNEALTFVQRDNMPRFETIQWYLDTIKLESDIEEVVEIINSIPKLY